MCFCHMLLPKHTGSRDHSLNPLTCFSTRYLVTVMIKVTNTVAETVLSSISSTKLALRLHFQVCTHSPQESVSSKQRSGSLDNLRTLSVTGFMDITQILTLQLLQYAQPCPGSGTPVFFQQILPTLNLKLKQAKWLLVSQVNCHALHSS